MRFPRTAVVVVAGAILLAACGGGEWADSATTLAPTGTTAASQAISTTETTSTTTADATTTTLAAEVLVAQVHSQVLTELLAGDERVVGPEAQLGLAEELTTGILLGHIRTVAVWRMASGSRSVGGVDSNIVKVTVTGDSASVSDCSRDMGEIYSASGELLKPAGDVFALIRSRLVLVDGAWKVRDIYTGGSHRCDPAAVSTQTTRASTSTVESRTSRAMTSEAMTSSKATSKTEVTPTTSASEALVAQVHTRVFTEVFAGDDRVDGPESRLPLAEELTTGVLLERLREIAAEDLASGERSVGGYESNIARVVVTGDSATVLDCSRDAAEGYSSAGELTVPADDFFKFRQSVLVALDGAWFVEGLYTGGDERCDPADYR